MKIVFFGASRYVIPVIELLFKHYDLSLVVTTEQNSSDIIPSYCQSKKIPYISISNFDNKIKQQLKEINPTLGALGYFGIILPQDVLDIFSLGILNIHPSLLPLYRGATPVQSAILNGDSETGTTIIRLDAQMDHGQILDQEKEPIHEGDTTDSLHEKLFKKGALMLKRLIPDYGSGKIQLHDQYEKKVTFTKRSLTRQDGYFDIENPPAPKELDQMIRAYYPWPAVWTNIRINQEKVKRIKFLPENKLQAEGGKPMSVKDFLNGYPELKEKLYILLGL